MRQIFTFILISLSAAAAFGQKAVVRGNVFDAIDGSPVIGATVVVDGTVQGSVTDLDGFFTIVDAPVGSKRYRCTSIGYDTVYADIAAVAGQVAYHKFTLSEAANEIAEVTVSAAREQKRSEVRISKVSVTQKQIKSLPSTGGEPDIVQYLQVLPGVISTGDQGGQLYIRGGAPVQNRMMIDGMTIYNPFHSIGFYSVFETEAVKNVEVTTGGFNAEVGGRIGAVVDIKTREGNRKNVSGLVSASPFMTKALIEGPILPMKEDGTSISYMFTGKHSYLDRTGNMFYNYAAPDSNGLPFSFTDFYGKVTMMTGNGSKLNLFGFNFKDRYKLQNVSELGWDAQGYGANFMLVPNNINFVINGTFSWSKYSINQVEYEKSGEQVKDRPRQSDINGFNMMVDFTNYGESSEFKYGFDITGIRTEFDYTNPLNLNFNLYENTTELAGFAKWRKKTGRLVIEPGLRFQYYVSLKTPLIEPRIGMKVNVAKNVRMKFAGGLYSQNLVSTVNEDDIVNLFVGFLSSPSGTIYRPGSNERVNTRLQRSFHAVGGIEVDLGKRTDLNIEPYFKRFTQLMNLNRNKIVVEDPDFVTETGNAYGIDFSMKHERENMYVWGTYSLGYVNRNNGVETYPTNFDRRHNLNFLVSYVFGKDKNWEFGTRWNYGSGFAFTLTQGFYNYIPFDSSLNTDVLTGNDDIGIILSDDRNSGRLSDYHRLDMSLKRTVKFSKTTKLELNASITNVYNRRNIFYVNRKEQGQKVYQLPILPSLSAVFSF